MKKNDRSQIADIVVWLSEMHKKKSNGKKNVDKKAKNK